MPDDQQEANCALGVCCCEENCADKRRKALASILRKNLGHTPCTPESVANVILNKFDLAEKDTLKPFVESIARLARGKDYDG